MFDDPPIRAATPAAPAEHRGSAPARVPPGWPPGVGPPGRPGWEASAAAWLLDQCPADYRAYASWRRHPRALAWLTCLHVEADLEAMRTAYRRLRAELVDEIGPEGVAQVLDDLQREGARLLATQRAAMLVDSALAGEIFVPRINGQARTGNGASSA